MNCECGEILAVYETLPMSGDGVCELLSCPSCGKEYMKRTGEPLMKRFVDEQVRCACGFHLRYTGRLTVLGRGHIGPDKIRWQCQKCGTRYGSLDTRGAELHALGGIQS